MQVPRGGTAEAPEAVNDRRKRIALDLVMAESGSVKDEVARAVVVTAEARDGAAPVVAGRVDTVVDTTAALTAVVVEEEVARPACSSVTSTHSRSYSRPVSVEEWGQNQKRRKWDLNRTRDQPSLICLFQRLLTPSKDMCFDEGVIPHLAFQSD